MTKYYLGCEGTQEEFYEFLQDLAQKIDWALHPWEHPTTEKALKEGVIRKPEKVSAVKETKAEPISPDNILPEAESEKTWTLEEIRALAKSKTNGPGFKKILAESTEGTSDKLSTTDPKFYPAIVKALEAL